MAAEGSFYDGYSRGGREKIAKAYEGVADHFEGRGNENRAEQYRGTAREIRKTLGGPMETAIPMEATTPEVEVEDRAPLEEQAEADSEDQGNFFKAVFTFLEKAFQPRD